mmetsp:Transcript_4036/g.4695  ORF Transcript_4036/g.4695 Transcript_4036/m.4695 type:complete len:92 (+) Transcript_4036:453-728(+)
MIFTNVIGKEERISPFCRHIQNIPYLIFPHKNSKHDTIKNQKKNQTAFLPFPSLSKNDTSQMLSIRGGYRQWRDNGSKTVTIRVGEVYHFS